MDHITDIQFDRHHAFYLARDDQLHPISSYHLDRLWRGEPDAAIPEFANRRIHPAASQRSSTSDQRTAVLQNSILIP